MHDPIGRDVVVPFRHQRLNRDGSLDCPDDAWKLQQETVAGVLHEPAAMIEDDRVDRGSMGLEGGVRTLLVGPHHSRVTGDISADYGSQASFHLCAPEAGRYHATWWSANQIQWFKNELFPVGNRLLR